MFPCAVLGPALAGIFFSLCALSRAETIFSEDFNSYYDGIQNALQYDTGLMVSYGGSLPAWSKAGAGAIHAVNLDYVTNYAVMLFHDNVITLTAGVVANNAGTLYRVDFECGPAVYANPAQVTTSQDGVVVTVLRSDDSVLSSFSCQPGAWAGTETLTTTNFTYVGDGSGPVRFRLSPLVPNNNHFAGAVDNFSVSDVGPAPPPTIVSHPVGGSVVEGDDFTFSVVASFAATYQWFKGSEAIPAATSSIYKISNVTTNHAGSYSVVVANSVGSATSHIAVLTVTPAPVYATYKDAVLAAHPIHYYPLDEASGTVAADLGSLPTAGSYNGGIMLNQPTGVAAFPSAAMFDGQAGTYVALGATHPDGSLSVEAWVKLDPMASHSPPYFDVVSQTGPSSPAAGVLVNLGFAPGDAVEFAAVNDSGTISKAGTAGSISRGQWHHLVGLFDCVAGSITVWVDGVQGYVVSLPGVLSSIVADTVPDWTLIGASRNGTNNSFNFHGLIAQVAIYDRVLTPPEIRSHFQMATRTAPPALSIEPAVIVSWPTFPVGYSLQYATNVSGPYSDYTGHVYQEDDNFLAPLPVRGKSTYFRLYKQ